MNELVEFSLLIAVALMVIGLARLSLNAEYNKWHNSVMSHEEQIRMQLVHAFEDRFGKNYHQTQKEYVSALTHGRCNTHWALSNYGRTYLEKAIRKGKMPQDVQSEIPNPTPDIYFDRFMINKLEQYHPVFPKDNIAY